jgi:arylsulfatase A
MDKKIGKLINFLKKNNLEKNTVVIYMGDNGTSNEIQSRFNGVTIQGQKDSTTTYGTHVPLIVYWPGTILSNSINNNLVSFTDFFPTLAALTHSADVFNPVDGIGFCNQLYGNDANARNFIFCSFLRDTLDNKQPVRWVQNTRYKLYDTLVNIYHAPGFYDMQIDIEEHNPLPDISLTPQQQNIKQNFRHILDSLK